MGTLVFQANLGGTVNLIGPNTASTVNFTLPSADGTSGQALVTNGSGTLSFSTFTSGAAGSNTQVQFNSSGAFAGSANLTFDGTTLTSNALTVTNATTLSAGTANGVAYLNGSKVLTSGSALTFDGTNLGVGVSSPAAPVDIQSNSGGTGIRVIGRASANAGAIRYFANDNTTQRARIESNDTGFEINSVANLPMYFMVNNAEQMRLTSTGLGIGTSSPSLLFQVGTRGGMSSSGVFQWGQALTGNSRGQLTWDTDRAIIESPLTLSFNTNSTERMRLDSSGNLLVGTASTGGSRFEVYASAEIARFYNTSGAGTIRFVDGNNVTKGSIVWNSSSTAYNTSSDYRLKHDIAPMTGALAKVAALKPVTYKWNADDSDGEGFIAHELAEVVPQCVTGEKDAVDAEGNPVYQGIDTSFLVATLTAAIKELKAEFDAYKATHP